MKLEGVLPIPSLTAEINDRGDVAILADSRSERDRELAYMGRARRRVHHCSSCGSADHTARNCNADGVARTKALLKARRK